MTELSSIHPGGRYIIITAHVSIPAAVEAMRRGASDYLTKPFDLDELLMAIKKAMRERLKDEELQLLRNARGSRYVRRPDARDIAKKTPNYPSKVMQSTMMKAQTAAATDTTILLLGESGSGKDFLAKYIHDNSSRCDGPFFAVNCAAVATELAESELFGHEPGAFTGARGRKRGLLELAQGGTLLLNEVGELSHILQAKLLTFLDTRSFTRVGGESQIHVEARLIAATNRPLEAEVKKGTFRQDLYYRLNVFSITVPPLRERVDDLPILAYEILGGLSGEMALPSLTIEAPVMEALMNYSWPGNIRELRNVLERASILSGEGPITRSSLALSEDAEEWFLTVSFPDKRSIHDVAEEVKRSLIAEALRRSGGSKQEAARLLGISRHALAHQIKSLGMEE